jgi:hypothetical protein
MFCPIIKDECSGKSCAWYSGNYEVCAVLLTGESLSDIHDQSLQKRKTNCCGLRLEVQR